MANADLWFLDAYAFIKLIIAEPESEELKLWMRGRAFASSDLLRTEARRAVAHLPVSARRRCDELLGAVHLIRLASALLDRVGRIPDRRLRSLDAIYVACAEQLGDDLAGFVSYDRRQLQAARRRGSHTASPGSYDRGRGGQGAFP